MPPKSPKEDMKVTAIPLSLPTSNSRSEVLTALACGWGINLLWVDLSHLIHQYHSVTRFVVKNSARLCSREEFRLYRAQRWTTWLSFMMRLVPSPSSSEPGPLPTVCTLSWALLRKRMDASVGKSVIKNGSLWLLTLYNGNRIATQSCHPPHNFITQTAPTPPILFYFILPSTVFVKNFKSDSKEICRGVFGDFLHCHYGVA